MSGVEQGIPTPSENQPITQSKDEILSRFQQLPPEHQATVGLVLVKSIMEGEWGVWFTDALTRRYLGAAVFPVVDRDVLRAARFTEDDIAQFSDEDLTRIAQQMREHYVSDLFGDEIFFHAQEVLESKRVGKSSEGSQAL